jgi:hypothetical protein
MEQFENIVSPDQIEIVAQSQVKKRKEHLGKLRLHKGQNLYELNLATLDITIPAIKDVGLRLDGSVKKEYLIKENHLYVVALNQANAERKFLNMARKIKESCSES